MARLYSFFIVVAALLCTSAAHAGDAAAGKTVFDAKCAECHYADDFAGESESVIAGLVAEARSGAFEHEDPSVTEISDADVANIVAYWASQE